MRYKDENGAGMKHGRLHGLSHCWLCTISDDVQASNIYKEFTVMGCDLEVSMDWSG
jgi:hypothetical protein